MFEKKQTGSDASDDKDKTSIPEQKEAEEERARGGAHKRARGGKMPEKMPHHARKNGGHVPGKMAKGRPDKRARGGQTGSADLHPMSSAGNMSMLDYEKGKRTNRDEEGAGAGDDKNAKGFG